jgi:hypothetical protein
LECVKTQQGKIGFHQEVGLNGGLVPKHKPHSTLLSHITSSLSGFFILIFSKELEPAVLSNFFNKNIYNFFNKLIIKKIKIEIKKKNPEPKVLNKCSNNR